MLPSIFMLCSACHSFCFMFYSKYLAFVFSSVFSNTGHSKIVLITKTSNCSDNLDKWRLFKGVSRCSSHTRCYISGGAAGSCVPPPSVLPAAALEDNRTRVWLIQDEPLKQSSPLISIWQNCLIYSPLSHEQGPAYQADFCPLVPFEGPCPQAQTGPSIMFLLFM